MRTRFRHFEYWIFVMALFAGLGLAAQTEAAKAQVETSTCLAIARNAPHVPLWRAQAGEATLASDEVRVEYVGHSAFRIETAAGVSIVTDFSGNYGDGAVPEVVTMNHAHSTHYTPFPDPAISHVLRGWNSGGDGAARHRLRVEDVYIRNVPTDLYSNGVMIEENGNSIFIFEVAGLCIGHLGHLHHKLTLEHIADIGRLDVLFMPVDGSYTMSQAGMIEIAETLRTSIVVPMHFFSNFSLQRFLAGMEGKFEIVDTGGREIVLSLRNLPPAPQVQILWPY